ncbi:Maf family protein [Ammonifex thiophilus]|uniref:dTTP/UTP pyrophosphatase n=1 Tax=Ammonifex thiophilus TaxID=444093 RepID=A0A3D8P2U9_9THEO|nr:Maf family protein [Ammonifex thiophilus]RDV82924.1 septum formation inhibitor Maf [Ammonifex thiophilus]
MRRIVLASTSPRRQEILRSLGVEFEVVAPRVKESFSSDFPPAEMAEELARLKVEEVASRVTPPALVIGADTIVVHRGKVLGKPRSEEEAKEMLAALQGNEHTVFTGVAVLGLPEGRLIKDHVATRVFFAPLAAEEIAAYVATGEPMDKAGAYAAQGKGALFIEKIEGCYFNVVGLPVFLLHRLLLQFGVNLLTGQGLEG